jgi:CheY-like chemotaxis protein
MKHVLLVDDDPLVLCLYQQALFRLGFKVDTASDGLEAIKALGDFVPDVMVLDLMMPRLSGAEVLKRMRADPQLAQLPVIVLSNAYMDPQVRDAAVMGARKGLLKSTCTPWLLAAVIEEVLGGKPAGEEDSQLLAAPAVEPFIAQPRRPVLPRQRQPVPHTTSLPATPESQGEPTRASDEALYGMDPDIAREEFLQNAAATCSALRELFQAFVQAGDEREAQLRLQGLYRKVHFVAAMAAIVECHQIAHMAAALEAVLFGLMNKNSLLSPSLRRTTGQVIEFFDELFQHAREWPPTPATTPQALVVDDDPLSNRLAVSALRNAHVQANSISSPLDALRLFKQNRYDLVLLDIEMEGMKGFEVSTRLRAIPGYLRTPVIFVTAHTDFDVRVKTIESGGDDLIAKPILPVELATKAVMHLLRTQMLTIPIPFSSPSEPLQQRQALDRDSAPAEPARSLETTRDNRRGSGRLQQDPQKTHSEHE